MAIQLQFTNNFYSWMSTVFLSEAHQDGETYTSGNPGYTYPIFGDLLTIENVKITGWGVYSYSYQGTNYSFDQVPLSNINANNSYIGSTEIMFGTDDSDFDPTDYCLGAEITSGLSVQLSAVHFTQDTDAILNITAKVKNTGAETIIIKEIGLTKHLKAYNNYPKVLFARGVYPNGEGVEIPSNTTKEITIQISMPTIAPAN